MTNEELERRLNALDMKYKEHITGLNLQISAMSTQYSALSMQYSLLLARVDVLEHPELQELPDVNQPPAPFQTDTAERSKVMNTPPKVVKRPDFPL